MMLFGAVLHLHRMVPNRVDADLQPRFIDCQSVPVPFLHTLVCPEL